MFLAGGLAGLARLVVKPQAQPNAVASDIHIHHLDLDHLAGAHHLVRVRDKLVAHRGDVNQTILVHTHIHERAESGNIGHGSLEDHAGLEILDLVDAFLELRSFKLGARVAPRLVQLGENVGHGRHTEGVVSEICRLEFGEYRRVADELLGVQARRLGDALHHRVSLRVYR